MKQLTDREKTFLEQVNHEQKEFLKDYINSKLRSYTKENPDVPLTVEGVIKIIEEL